MIVFTDHAKDKLLKEIGKLGITEKVVIEILRNPDGLLYDASTDRFVAFSWSRNVAVIYEKTNGDLIIVTVIYSSQLRDIVDRRRRIGRWI
ncbi:MAG: hypothetical protein QW231_00740 [Candidatus Bathyarchaeia archaeon]